MMIQPNPGVLDQLIRERQEQLRRLPLRAEARATSGLRTRVGLALIAVGTALSGERVELPARSRELPKAA